MRGQVLVLVMVAACGAPPDVDDPGIDNPDLVIASGVPPGQNVTFIDNDGVLIAEVAADAAGNAQADMPAGGSVLLLTVDRSATSVSCRGQMTTSVRPGDHLSFASAAPRGNQESMTVWFTPVPGAQTRLYTPCGATNVWSTVPGATLQFFPDCLGEEFDLLMVASGGPLMTPVFTAMPGVRYRAGGAFELAGTQVAMQDFTVTLHGVRPPDGTLSVTRAAVIDSVEFGPTSNTVSPASTTESVILPYEQGFGSGSVVVVSWPGQDVAVRKPTIASTIDIDLGAMRLPSPTSVTWTPNGLRWTTDGVGNVPDAVAVTWHGTRTFPAPYLQLDYRLLGPWSDHLSVPPLPEQYAECDPNRATLTQTSFVDSEFVAVDYAQIDGYDELRQQPADLFDPLGTIRAFDGLEVQRSSIRGNVRGGHHP
jgi:hypothetical protein